MGKQGRQMDNTYKNLLSSTRFRTSTSTGRPLVVESESDRARLVFSAPFRRLQQKAQVFSLEENAAVRSRLTHSLEVAQIGRFIAERIAEKLIETNSLPATEGRALVNFVEVACLMHDLGNPPFGHFGEAAIASWFKDNGFNCVCSALGGDGTINLHYHDKEIYEVLADFFEFDGNCQGLRIATLLQWNADEFGLNLTYTSLASYLKYIRPPAVDPSPFRSLPFRKKAGFFKTEQPIVEKIWRHFGYSVDQPKRFPLAYIMEAADDIAYCISDLEDSIEKDLLDSKHLFNSLHQRWQQLVSAGDVPSNHEDTERITEILKNAAESKAGKGQTFVEFRTSLSTRLTDVAYRTYCAEHNDILAGSCPGLIPSKSPGGAVLDLLKSYCVQHVYQHISVQRTELAGWTAITGLLQHFRVLLECSRERFEAALSGATKDGGGNQILIERKLLALFPEKHKAAYRHSIAQINDLTTIHGKLSEWNHRAHLITDFVSGMTDDFALSTFQNLSGIKVA